MEYKIVPPSHLLSEVIDHFWYLSLDEADLPYHQALYPFGRSEFFFELGKEDLWFINFLSKSENFVYESPFRAFGISLKPWASDFLLNEPISDLTNQIVAVSNLVGDFPMDSIQNSSMPLIHQLESYLLEKLKNYNQQPVTKYVAQEVKNRPDENIFNIIKRNVGYSQRRVEQLFKISTGTSIGQFIQLTKFEHSLQLLANEQDVPLTHVGLRAGYYDQSHFIRAVKRFTGHTPGQLRKSALEKGEIEKDFIFN